MEKGYAEEVGRREVQQARGAGADREYALRHIRQVAVA
jgi:hypothetical protein